MAARLTVILNQAAPAVAPAQRLCESVIGELIGRPGIDLILVASLRGLAGDATDRLTLESIRGDTAVLDWQSPGETCRDLAEIGFAGSRWPHASDLDAAPPEQKSRRIYAFDLNRFETADAVCSALTALLSSRQVRTFTLGMPGEQPSRTRSRTKPAAAVQSQLRPQQSLPRDDPHHQPPASAPATTKSLDLDALVDQLDEFDA